jgi:hypothetical protein
LHTLLISTHTKLLLVHLEDDLKSANVKVLESGFRYYGIANSPYGLWVAKNTRDPESITQIVDVHTGDSLDFETPLKDVHQITYANDGLYICNTYYNSVVYKSLTTGVEDVFTIGGEFEQDYAHPNSLWLEGSYVYVMLHNKRWRRSEIARLQHSPRHGFDYGYRAELRYKLHHAACHNLRMDRAVLTYLASDDSIIMQINHLTGRPLRGVAGQKGGYLHGLATLGDVFVFGSNPLVSAEERYESRSGLGFMSRGDGGYLHMLDLTTTKGEVVTNINEIRVLSDDVFAPKEADPPTSHHDAPRPS